MEPRLRVRLILHYPHLAVVIHVAVVTSYFAITVPLLEPEMAIVPESIES